MAKQKGAPRPSGIGQGAIGAIAACFFVGGMIVLTCAILYFLRYKWELDVRYRHTYQGVPPVETALPEPQTEITELNNGTTTIEPENGTAATVVTKKCGVGNAVVEIKNAPESVGRRGMDRFEKRKCICKLVTGSITLILLLLVLALMIPLYIIGITPPLLGTDDLQFVRAGSLLFLDCLNLTLPASNLLYVTWSMNGKPFYRQHVVYGPVGTPANNTLGMRLGRRVQPQSNLGQANVWPVLPGEDAIFMCEVAKVADDHGGTVIKRKTIGVIVVTGIVQNKFLISMVAIALLLTFGLAALLLYHALRRRIPDDHPSSHHGNMGARGTSGGGGSGAGGSLKRAPVERRCSENSNKSLTTVNKFNNFSSVW